MEEKRERKRRAADEERAADAAMEAARLRSLKLQQVGCWPSQTFIQALGHISMIFQEVAAASSSA